MIIGVGAVLVVTLWSVWWLSLTVSIASETSGPCPMNLTKGMTKLGWSWSQMGYVCEARLSDGSTYRYVARWTEPPEAVVNDAGKDEP